MSDDSPFDIQATGGVPVDLPSGSRGYVQTESERIWLEDKAARYLEDNHFKNVSDFLDIDKLVMFELMIHRWSMFLSKGKDYWDEEISPRQYADMMSDASREVRQLKKALGVDKTTRDKTTGEDSIPARWANLKARAKEFGYMRNQQAIEAIEGMARIASVITAHRNMDDEERAEFGFEIDDVIDVIWEVVDKYKEIDEKFRNEVQRYWIKDPTREPGST